MNYLKLMKQISSLSKKGAIISEITKQEEVEESNSKGPAWWAC